MARAVTDVFGQDGFRVRLEWGPVGAAAMGADIAVVVDVLSFSTAVCVAVGRGCAVHPFPWRDERAAGLARELGADLAVGRQEASGTSAPSLSPAVLLTCDLAPRLVLPSPNGSTIAAALDRAGGTVVAGCLRNAAAVAAWLRPALREGRSLALVAAGERWGRDGSLRPALEDQLGAGAIAAALRAAGTGGASPEAEAAADLFEASRGRLRDRLLQCASGRELTAIGFRADVEVAAALDASAVVPVLVDGAFTAAP